MGFCPRLHATLGHVVLHVSVGQKMDAEQIADDAPCSRVRLLGTHHNHGSALGGGHYIKRLIAIGAMVELLQKIQIHSVLWLFHAFLLSLRVGRSRIYHQV